MTSGSSQGLFVIVAVVIFGIFVLISYVLFQDKLQVGLGTIFTDSFDNVSKNINGGENEEEAESKMFVFDKPTGTIEGFKEEFVEKETKLEIPNEINGTPVTKIEDSAFKDEQFTELTIPSTVTEIGTEAFYSSPIENLTINKTVKVGKDAFYTSYYNAERKDTMKISLRNAESIWDGATHMMLGNTPISLQNPTKTIDSLSGLNQGSTEFLIGTTRAEIGSDGLLKTSESGFNFTSNYSDGGNKQDYSSKENESYFYIASKDFQSKDANAIADYVKNNLKFNNDIDIYMNVQKTKGDIKSVKVNGTEVKPTNANKDSYSFKASDIGGVNFKQVVNDGISGEFRFNNQSGYDTALMYNSKTGESHEVNIFDYVGNPYISSLETSTKKSVEATTTFKVEVETSTGVKYTDDFVYSFNFNIDYKFK